MATDAAIRKDALDKLRTISQLCTWHGPYNTESSKAEWLSRVAENSHAWVLAQSLPPYIPLHTLSKMFGFAAPFEDGGEKQRWILLLAHVAKMKAADDLPKSQTYYEPPAENWWNIGSWFGSSLYSKHPKVVEQHFMVSAPAVADDDDCSAAGSAAASVPYSPDAPELAVESAAIDDKFAADLRARERTAAAAAGYRTSVQFTNEDADEADSAAKNAAESAAKTAKVLDACPCKTEAKRCDACAFEESDTDSHAKNAAFCAAAKSARADKLLLPAAASSCATVTGEPSPPLMTWGSEGGAQSAEALAPNNVI